ncbi:MAG: SDR family oxidoreductase [Bacteroidales bacterium]|nr:SDR family oxidoreductase [Bacteroidales bacterium]
MISPFSLENKRILVTGASSGIGANIAIECSKMGANIIITGRNNKGLEDTFNKLKGESNKMIIADLKDSKDLENLVLEIDSLDGLVNNAGINKRVPCGFISEDDIDSVMGINFTSSVLLVKGLLSKRKIKKGSSIVFISSISVYRPAIGNALYAASKAAIDSYMRVLAIELSKKKIRVNSIHPGMVWTPLVEKSQFDIEQYKENEKLYPLGRYGKPEDVAYAAIYLLSNASSWMTGTLLTLDGGISLK